MQVVVTLLQRREMEVMEIEPQRFRTAVEAEVRPARRPDSYHLRARF
eukprot:SAG11_NODE_4715_length_1795_cov_1.525943_2_plen_47_part_00